MKNLTRLLILCFSLAVVFSCKKDNAVADPFSDVSLDASVLKSSEPLTIYGNTRFDFTLKVPDGKYGIVSWDVDNVMMPLYFYNGQQIGYIDVDGLLAGDHILRAKIYLYDADQINQYRFLSIKPGDKPVKECTYEIRYEEPNLDIGISIQIDDIDPSESIYIYSLTSLQYSVITEEGLSGWVNWKIGDKTMYSYLHNDKWRVTIDPSQFEDGDYILTANAYVGVPLPAPESGVTEDITVKKQYEFKVKILTQQKNNLNIRQGITDDGYLKIEWDKPDLIQTPVEKYEVEYIDKNGGGVKMITIADPDETYFIDKNYVYGDQRIMVRAVFKNDKISPLTSTYTVKFVEIKSNDILFEEVGLDKLWIKFNWPPYKSQARIYMEGIGYNTGGVNVTRNNFPMEITRPPFPGKFNIRIYLYSESATQYSYYTEQLAVANTCYYNYLTVNDFLDFVPSPYDGRVYIVERSKTTARDSKTLIVINQTSYLNTITVNLVVDPNSTRKVLQNMNEVRVYKDGTLTNPVYFEINAGNNSKGVLGFAEDHRLLILVVSGAKKILNAYNPDNGDFLGTVSFPKEYPVSSSGLLRGKYLAMQSDDKLDLYEINGLQATLLKTYTESDISVGYKAYSFHTYGNKTCLAVTAKSNNRFALVELPSCTLAASTDYYFDGSDPFTGNLLLFSRDYLAQTTVYVWKGDMSTQLFTLKTSSFGNDCYLFDNIIYNNASTGSSWMLSHLDLSKYIMP